MLGRNLKGGAAKEFDELIGRKTHKTWDYAHALQRCMAKADKEAPGFKEFESILSGLHTFYGNQNHKVSSK